MKTLLLIFTALLTFNTVAQSDYEEYRKGRFWGKAPISEEEQEQIDKEKESSQMNNDILYYYSVFYGDLTKNWINIRN